MTQQPEMSNVNGVLIPNFDSVPIEHTFPETEVPSAEDEEENDGKMLDALIEAYLKSLEAVTMSNDKDKTEVTLNTCKADIQNCSDKLGIR
jgi:hypothetical protein